LLFKVVCVVAKSWHVAGNGHGELIFSTLVHSASPGDKWSTSPSPVVIQGWKFFRHTARAGDALFNYSFTCPSVGGAATSAAASAFLDKEYILISSRYQLHSTSATTQCPSNNTDAHSQKKKKNYRK
jgi:hypothetical protein